MTRHWQDETSRPFRRFLSKVPEITMYFWTVKVLATTVGATLADFLANTLGLGLTLTTVAMSLTVGVALWFQFSVQRYIPWLYWLVVELISVVGILLTGNLVDNLEVPPGVAVIVFAVALAATFAAWYACEKSLSIHTIDTPRRELFYWLAILFTFALSTAAGGLAAGRLGLHPALTAVVLAALIAVVALAHRRFGLSAVLAFWIAYVLTRPLGASLGDLLSQPRDIGGLGLGTVTTSLVFLAAIVAVVVYLTWTRRDTPSLNQGRRHAVVGA